jgi:hypothetical protein
MLERAATLVAMNPSVNLLSYASVIRLFYNAVSAANGKWEKAVAASFKVLFLHFPPLNCRQMKTYGSGDETSLVSPLYPLGKKGSSANQMGRCGFRSGRAVFWSVTPVTQLEAHLFTDSAIRFSVGLRKTMKI